LSITPSPSRPPLLSPCFFHNIIIFFFTSSSSSQFTTTNLRSPREGGDGVEEPTAVEAGTKEDDDDKSRRRKMLEKGKEPAVKDTDEEPLFDDNKFAAELLRSTFRKLEGVGEAFNIKVHHDAYKDPTLKGLAFRIYGLAEKLKNIPAVKRAARRHFFFDDGSSDGDDGSHSDDGNQGGDGGTLTN
jgi:hypothetical protein